MSFQSLSNSDGPATSVSIQPYEKCSIRESRRERERTNLKQKKSKSFLIFCQKTRMLFRIQEIQKIRLNVWRFRQTAATLPCDWCAQGENVRESKREWESQQEKANSAPVSAVQANGVPLAKWPTTTFKRSNYSGTRKVAGLSLSPLHSPVLNKKMDEMRRNIRIPLLNRNL